MSNFSNKDVNFSLKKSNMVWVVKVNHFELIWQNSDQNLYKNVKNKMSTPRDGSRKFSRGEVIFLRSSRIT